MAELKNIMDIFKLLDKSNCRRCNKPTCLAFAAAVFQGQRQLGDCPQLRPNILARYEGTPVRPQTIEQEQAELVAQLKHKITALDLRAAARRLKVPYADGEITIRCMGKNIRVDTRGKISTDIHVHVWIAILLFNYIISGAGCPPSGRWLPFRELKGGKNGYRLFEQRCEKPLKRIADTYTALFEDMIHLFNGKAVQNHYAADISLVLHPLPYLPLLICYWKPEGGLESDLNLFFDATAEENLDIDSISVLGRGLAAMFEKLALRHGGQ